MTKISRLMLVTNIRFQTWKSNCSHLLTGLCLSTDCNLPQIILRRWLSTPINIQLIVNMNSVLALWLGVCVNTSRWCFSRITGFKNIEATRAAEGIGNAWQCKNWRLILLGHSGGCVTIQSFVYYQDLRGENNY